MSDNAKCDIVHQSQALKWWCNTHRQWVDCPYPQQRPTTCAASRTEERPEADGLRAQLQIAREALEARDKCGGLNNHQWQLGTCLACGMTADEANALARISKGEP